MVKTFLDRHSVVFLGGGQGEGLPNDQEIWDMSQQTNYTIQDDYPILRLQTRNKSDRLSFLKRLPVFQGNDSSSCERHKTLISE